VDPDETLEELRRLSIEAAHGNDVSRNERELRWLFDDLDSWLSRGGFLPTAWKE